MSTPTSTAADKPLIKKELKKFQELLQEKRLEVLDRARKTLTQDMTLDTNDLADEIDLAASESILSFEFQLRGREKTLLAKIDLALKKIEEGTFGICERCDQPIGKMRLEARPETTLCIACKEDQERDERNFG
jgi:DnaK suppressor protein